MYVISSTDRLLYQVPIGEYLVLCGVDSEILKNRSF